MLATVAAVIGLSVTGTTAAVAADRVSYPGSHPSWATQANDQGAAADDETVEGEIYLPLRDPAGAEALATAVSTPGLRGYRAPLSPQQWISRFSPTQADTDAVVDFLKSQGLTITAVPTSRLYVVFRGTAAQLEGGFLTELHSYSYAGTRLVAPASAPSVPTAIAHAVSGVSLDQARLLTRPDSIKQGDLGTEKDPQLFNRKAAAPPVVDTPCSQYIGQHVVTVPASYNGQTRYSTYNCGYTPAQLRSAYGVTNLVKSGTNGAGQTVAIVDAYASPSIVKDVNTYSAALGEPGLTAATYQQIVPDPSRFTDQEACQEPSGWQGEQTLDVEAVHGIAPGAKILYVGGTNCGGGLDVALSTILDGKLATIVSNSYGNLGEAIPDDVLKGEENLHIQAAGEGIGLYFSSGDNGDEVANLGYASPDFPASSPFVTAVGGTTLGIDRKGTIAFETGWGDTVDQIVKDSSGRLSYTEPLPGTRFAGGAGGGTSAVFAQPAYQRGIVPSSLAKGHRVSPDIAALADPYTGFLIGIRPIVDDTTLATGDYGTETYGGTSLASPLTAAQIAIVQQSTHSTIGFANPTLYGIDRILPLSFRDVVPQNPRQAVAYTSATSGNSYLVSFDTDTSLTTQRRYDDVTGIGEVSFTLLSLLAQGRH
ncbi:MAG TPA: S53 family peptidase [Lacisediminihabitans sp.]|uniref:S53 family peptidase n=1 Tax=Lacisediminihabitans sp. TaxID=2787631 RepID=UPI002ED81C26